MSDNTKIEWTEATWNPIRGCSRVSQGCVHCYAEGVARRFSGPGKPYEGLINQHGSWNGNIAFIEHVLDQPLRWRRPRRIFVNSMSDLFHENITDEQIDQIFAVMDSTKGSHHTFQVLTKRPERMRDYMVRYDANKMGPPPNVWLGVSVENQEAADERIPLLLQTPAAVRFLSCEPLLGPINLTNIRRKITQLHWVIVGGESGRGARPMHPDWARSLLDQCQAAGVPFFFKQWGEWGPYDIMKPHKAYTWKQFDDGALVEKVGKKLSGRLLDGRTWDEYPEVAS